MTTKADLEGVVRVNSHLLWPWKYWLPLKRYVNNDLETGLIHWQDKTTVYLGANLFTVVKGELKPDTPTIKYPSVEAMLAEWQAD